MYFVARSKRKKTKTSIELIYYVDQCGEYWYVYDAITGSQEATVWAQNEADAIAGVKAILQFNVERSLLYDGFGPAKADRIDGRKYCDIYERMCG
jgi:hypothetical protein